MLMVVKNQIKVILLSIKYAIMREMLNKVTFIINVIFMIINDATLIVQWIILFNLKTDIGGYTFNQVLLLWGLAAGTFGISRFIFKNAFNLSDLITNGKLDSFLVQPKNVLLSIITGQSDSGAFGDIIYAYILLFISGCTIERFFLYTLFLMSGSIIIVSFAVILASFSFWFDRSDYIADTGNSMITYFATYPDGIFHGLSKALLYSIIPIGFISYIPVKVVSDFDFFDMLIVALASIVSVVLAFVVFYRGLRKYSSSNLMMSKI